MIAASEDELDEHISPSVLNDIKQEVMVIDLINQLDIADGLKELLLSSNFTFKSLLNTSTSNFALMLGIDHYVAKIISDAVNKPTTEVN
ncbi:MAG TPA: hypothetical protein VN922_21505 [Bacteroidia bacterium]|nr:hypothetical protein [Bacteroidia bacterium]